MVCLVCFSRWMVFGKEGPKSAGVRRVISVSVSLAAVERNLLYWVNELGRGLVVRSLRHLFSDFRAKCK